MAAMMPRVRTYRVALEPDGSAWNVSVPALPGCFTCGASEGEALERAEEAIRCHIRGLLADGAPVPPADRDAPRVTVLTPA